MATTGDRLALWAPRILGIAMAMFLSLFALDAVGPGKPLAGFAVHLTPSILLLTLVAAGWRWPWMGAVAFIALAGLYVGMVPGRGDWILTISLPLLIVGCLFLWSWTRTLRPGV